MAGGPPECARLGRRNVLLSEAARNVRTVGIRVFLRPGRAHSAGNQTPLDSENKTAGPTRAGPAGRRWRRSEQPLGRSADLLPAEAPDFIRQTALSSVVPGAGGPACRLPTGETADCQSALRRRRTPSQRQRSADWQSAVSRSGTPQRRPARCRGADVVARTGPRPERPLEYSPGLA